jgi:hypothetical protein
MFVISKDVVFTATILDAGYLMLDILEFPSSEIQKYPDFGELPSTCSGPEPGDGSRAVSRNQYPGSRNITNYYRYSD